MEVTAVARVLDHATSSGPRCGSISLIGIDGRSGVGKTTLALEICTLAQQRGYHVAVIHTDDLCPGWDGLPLLPPLVETVIEQLARHGRADLPTWDWANNAAGARTCVRDADLVIVEGVTATDPRWRDRLSAAVWLQAPEIDRKRRALDRDREQFAPYWDSWSAAEDHYYATRPGSEPDFTFETTSD